MATRGKKRSAEQAGREMVEEASGLVVGDMVDLSNKTFTLYQLASAYQDRHAMRVQLMKKDAEVEALLGQLGDLPSARALINSLEKKYKTALEKEKEVLEKSHQPLKKKARTGKEPAKSQSSNLEASEEEELVPQ